MSAEGNHGQTTSRDKQPVGELQRWSQLDFKLPDPGNVQEVHIYDFDNTVFNTPMPNKKVWDRDSILQLMSRDCFDKGGWWHDDRILASAGDGLEKEEARAWEGWWNETIVKLCKLSAEQPGVLSVLVTGRGQQNYTDLLQRMLTSKGLTFNIILLKPSKNPNGGGPFDDTIEFKESFFTDLLDTYDNADEVRIYEDRPKHAERFKRFLMEYNSKSKRSMKTEVISVPPTERHLKPEVEVRVIKQLLEDHNEDYRQGKHTHPKGFLRIHRQIFYTGYLIDEETTQKLLKLLPFDVPSSRPSSPSGGVKPEKADDAPDDVRYLANNILIKPGPCSRELLKSIGGMGHKVKFETVSLGSLNDAIWAVRVMPVPRDAVIKPINEYPMVVLAHKKDCKPINANYIRNWVSISDAKWKFEFETKIGERSIFQIQGSTGRRDERSRGGQGNEAAARDGDRDQRGEKVSPMQNDNWRERNPPGFSGNFRTSGGDRRYDSYRERGGYSGGRNDSRGENNHYKSRPGNYERDRGGRGAYRGDHRQNRGGEGYQSWKPDPRDRSGYISRPRYNGGAFDGPADGEENLRGPEGVRGEDVVMREGGLQY